MAATSSADDLGLLAEGAAEAEPEVERHADDQGHVGALQAGAAGAAEGELVVGGDAAAAHAVEEDRDAERLGERLQLVLAVGPVDAGAGHDHRALGAGEQRRGLLGAVGGLGGRRARRGGDLGLGLHEDDVERIVEEGRAARRRRAPRSSAAAVRSGISAGVLDRLRAP